MRRPQTTHSKHEKTSPKRLVQRHSSSFSNIGKPEPYIRLLIFAGVSSKDLDARGMSTSERAKQQGQSKLFDFVNSVEEEYIEFQKSLGKHALDENWKEFHEVLEYLGLVNTYLSEGRTLLQEAAKLDAVIVITILIQIGAKIGIKSKYGRTEIHFVAESGSLRALFEFINHGADVKLQGKDGRTPLYLAAQSGSEDNIKTLLNNGADAKTQSKDGRTPLHFAAQSGSGYSIRTLLNHGADVRIQEKDGQKLFSRGTNSTLCFNFLQPSCKSRQHFFDGIREICFSNIPPPLIIDQIKQAFRILPRNLQIGGHCVSLILYVHLDI